MQNSFFVHQLGFCAQTLSKCRLRRDKGVFVYILTPFTVTSTPQENYQKRYKKSIFEYICMLMPSAGRTKQRGGPPVGDPWPTPTDNFCLQPKRINYPLHTKATLFINFCATMIVGTWFVLLQGYNRGLSSTYLKLFFRDLLLKFETHFPALGSQLEGLKLKLLSPL